MSLSAGAKSEVIKQYRRAEGDTGSPEVQVALLSSSIDGLQSHFAAYRKDHSSRRGLISMVNRRRKLLDYLKRRAPDRYRVLIERLKLRR